MQAVKHALGLDHAKTADNTTGHSTTGQTHSGPADTTHNPNDTTHTSLSDATGTTNSHNLKTDSNKHTFTSDYGFGKESHTGEVLNRDGNNGGLADRAAQATGMGGAGHQGLTSGSGITGEHHSHGTGTGTGTGLTGDHSSHSHSTGTGAGVTGAAASAASGLTGNSHSHSHTGTGTGLTGSTANTNTGAGYDRDTASSGAIGSSHTHDENCSHGHPSGTAGHGRIGQAMDKVQGEWEGFHRADGRRFECDALDASQLANRNTGGQQSGLERV